MSLFIADLVTLAPCAAVRMTCRMEQYGRSAVFSIYLSTVSTHRHPTFSADCVLTSSRYKYKYKYLQQCPSTAPATSSRAAGDFIKPNVGTFTPAQPSPAQPRQPILGTTGQGTITRGFTRVLRCPYITLHPLSCVTCHVTSVWCVTCHMRWLVSWLSVWSLSTQAWNI